MQHKLIIITLISLFSFTLISEGQKLVNSPYSRFNIGTLEPAGSFRSLGMGGIGTSIRDNNSIYFSNPASYSSLDTNSFIFDFGVDYSKNIISNDVLTHSSDDMNFDHFFIGFPLSRGWGCAAGLVPLSNGYYKLSEKIEEGDQDYDPITGTYTSYHNGKGGFTNLFIGTGININKNFSVGANLTVLFGQIERTNILEFADYVHEYNNIFAEKLHINGINLDLGIQYSTILKNDYILNAGLSLTPGKSYHSNYESLLMKYAPYTLYPYSPDTLSYVSDNSTKAFFPGTFRLGVSFGKKDKLVAGIDYISTNWSNAKISGSSGYLADIKSLLFGVEYIPDKNSNYSFLKRVEYRAGGHIENNYLIINGIQIKEYGITAGIGIPMRRTFSRTNLFFDFTRKDGSINKGLHNENYFTMGISLNLYDQWFMKRKYD
jgi:hypothetical protein